MTLPLEGRTVALAEGRQLEELARLLEKEGATAWRCPMVSILDAPEAGPVVDWLRELIDGRFHLVVLMTGEAVRRLLGFADRVGLRAEVIAALQRARTLTRGPKPVQALKEVGVAPGVVAEAPTTAGVIAALRREPLAGQTVAFTLYGDANPALEQFLRQAGATPRPVLAYVYAPAADAERVAELIQRLANGTVDVLLFTSSMQVDRLFEVAKERGLEESLRAGLQRSRIASVGPVLSDHLRQRNVRIDLCPEQGFVMKNLVQLIKRDLLASGA